MNNHTQPSRAPRLEQIKTNLVFAMSIVRSQSDQAKLLDAESPSAISKALAKILCASPFFKSQGLGVSAQTGLPQFLPLGVDKSSVNENPSEALDLMFGAGATADVFSQRGEGRFDAEILAAAGESLSDPAFVIKRLRKALDEQPTKG